MKNISIFKRLASKKLNEGFSIIETLVTIFVFSILAILIASIFSRGIQLERRTFAVQKVQENALFVLESMARKIRVSEVGSNDDPTCSTTTLSIDHPDGALAYFLSSGIVKEVFTDLHDLSSSDVEFTRLAFCISGSSLGDNLPFKVTIIASVRSKNNLYQTPIDIQTTITSRILD